MARWKRVTLVCRAWCTAWGKSKQQGVKGGEIAFPLCAINVSLALWPWCSAITTTIALWHRYIKRLNLKQPPILAPKSPEWPPLSFFSSSRHVLMSAMTKGTRMSPNVANLLAQMIHHHGRSRRMSGIPLSRKAFRSSKIREGDVELARLTSKSFRLLFFFLFPLFSRKSSLLRFDVALFDERASLCGQKRVGCFLFAG